MANHRICENLYLASAFYRAHPCLSPAAPTIVSTRTRLLGRYILLEKVSLMLKSQQLVCRRCAVPAVLCLVLLAWSASADSFKKHPQAIPVGPEPEDIVAADMNGDGLPEIFTADRGEMYEPREERPANNELSYLKAEGDLTYSRQTLPTGFGPYCIAVANMDALPAPDLVVGNFHAAKSRHISLFRNVEDNLLASQFELATDTLSYARMRDFDGKPVYTLPGITALIVKDVDGDGYRDVLATGWSCDVLIFVPGVYESYLGEPRYIPAYGGPRDLAAADFDGDKHTDLVTTMYCTNEVALWKGDGTGAFEEAGRFPSRGALPHKVAVADMNRDGEEDLVVSHCHADDSIVIFFGDGGFQFSLSQEILLGKERAKVEHEVRDLVVADFDNDRRMDIAVACYASQSVIVLMNKSKKGQTPLTFDKETYTFKNGSPRALCTADFDKDDNQDIGIALWNTDAVTFLLGK